MKRQIVDRCGILMLVAFLTSTIVAVPLDNGAQNARSKFNSGRACVPIAALNKTDALRVNTIVGERKGESRLQFQRQTEKLQMFVECRRAQATTFYPSATTRRVSCNSINQQKRASVAPAFCRLCSRTPAENAKAATGAQRARHNSPYAMAAGWKPHTP